MPQQRCDPTRAGGALTATGGRTEARAASLRRLHGLVRSINGDLDLGRALTAVCRGVVEGLGFGVAVVNLVQPDGDLEVVACEGSEPARDALLGQRGTRAFWQELLDGCEPVGDLLVDYRHVFGDDDRVPTWLPDPPSCRVEGGWDPLDSLLAPLHTRASGLLGVLSVDLPENGLRPGEEQLELLEMYAAQASIAIENAQLHSSLKEQAEARARALGRLTAFVDSAPVAFVELDLDGRVRFWNGAAEAMFGWAQDEVLGRRNPVAPEEHYGHRLQELRTSRAVPSRRVQATRTRRDGTGLDLEMTTTVLLDDDDRPYGYLGVYVDVTHRRQLEQELRTAAFTDPLTALANRARFTARLAAVAADAAVVLLDLDGFKGVNDTLGHAAGDRLLVEVARRLRGVCREDDLVARLGGDEFVVLLTRAYAGRAADGSSEQVGPGEAAEALARRLVEVLALPFDVGDRRVQLGASVGLARAGSSPPGGPGGVVDGAALGDALLRDADVAMYAAKADGKGRVRVFEPALREAVVERTELVQDLRAALARDELFLRWQPVAEVGTGAVVGLEALVRWQHPQRGELEPAAFVALAEETGLVVALGRLVLVQACAGLRAWQDLRRPGDAGRPPLSVSVNLSPVQVHAPGLVATVTRALDDSGLAPQSLVLELTEDVLLHDTEAALAVLSELRGFGVRVAVDDFGAGYSSLSYLRRLPLDLVKLDRSLLADADRDPPALALLEAVVALTRRLGLVPCAEGVETASQWHLLHRLQCRLAQGHLLSPPLLAGEVPALLQAGLASRLPRPPVPR